MHFRVRQRVVQLVRTVYDPVEKKPRASVIGRISLDLPEISAELRAQLTEAECAEAEAWVINLRRTSRVREEYAALMLPENMRLAEAWISRNKDSAEVQALVSMLIPAMQDFRKTLRVLGLLDRL